MAGRLAGVAVLMYHRVGALGVPADAPDRKYWVSAAALRQHLSQIRYSGLRVALLDEHRGEPDPPGRTRMPRW